MPQPDLTASEPEQVVARSILVACSVQTAFRVWTEQIHVWWPAGHSRSGDPATQVLIEGRVGGRFYERTTQGVEHDWGQVLLWEPPHRLVYSWYLGSGPEQPTRVDVRFVVLSPDQTQVEVEHRGPELIGALWGRNQARYRAAWDVVLAAFAKGQATLPS